MKNNFIWFLIGIILLLGFYISITNSCGRKIKNDNKDLKQIINSSGIQAERFKDKEGKEHYKNPVEEIINPNNLQQDPELKKILSSFDVRLKNIETISSTVTHSHTSFYTHFKDSTINDTVKTECFSYKDPWTNIEGCNGDSTYFDSYDTTNLLIYKERYNWPQIKIGRKILKGPKIGKQVITSDIFNSNPHNKIIVNKTTVVKKRK